MTEDLDRHAADEATDEEIAAYRRMIADLVLDCRQRLAELRVPPWTEPLCGWGPEDD